MAEKSHKDKEKTQDIVQRNANQKQETESNIDNSERKTTCGSMVKKSKANPK